MKKIIICLSMLLAAFTSNANQNQGFSESGITPLELQVKIIDPTEAEIPIKRTPETIPTIYFDGNTLYFATSCDGYTLQIVDEAENICYDLVIPMGTTELELPENLFDEYELRIIRGNTCYYDTININ